MKKRTLFRMTFFQSSSNGIVCQCRFHFSISYVIYYIVCYSIYFSIELEFHCHFSISHIIYILHCVLFNIFFQSSSNWGRVSMPLPSGHCHFCISYLDISAAVLLHIKGRLFDNIEGGEFFLKSYKKIER